MPDGLATFKTNGQLSSLSELFLSQASLLDRAYGKTAATVLEIPLLAHL